ncbi:hypothetical protein COLO4_14830 [Corchorus olitorius]|uniref:SAWADEE domain-containing protein n=1 Tax=Corchorus olitorius TaxID=93759 RepID=A0A1R3JQJ0_9ROSI|nr:hypothetical protein COLO4_14830 [Corchorus olitorius]
MEVEADNSMELEAKRKDDSSWHPCRVSLSSSGDSLVVNFGSQEMEDMVLKKEEVLMHLRFRSMPLQFDDCCHIEEGERVLANYNSKSKNLFHDAEVEKKDFPEDILWRNRANPDHHNHLKRTTPSERKLRVDIEAEDLSGHTASMQEEFMQNRSHLSPLASRAALASSLLAAKRCLDMDFSSCMNSNMLVKGKHSPGTLAFSDPLVLEASHATSPLISIQKDASCKPSLSVPNKDWPNGNKTSGIINCNAEERPFAPENVTKGVANSSAESKTAGLSISRAKKSSANANLHSTAPIRLTRSSAQKGAIISNDGIQVEIRDDDMKRRVPGKKNRLSQPAVCQGNENLANAEENDLTHVTDSDSSNGKIAAAESDVAIRLTRSAARKGAIIPNDGIQVEIHDDDMKRRIPGKKNRSSQPVVCQGNENLANEEENDLTHVIDSDSSNGKIAAAESNVAIRLTRSAARKGAIIPNDGIQVEIHDDDTKRRIPGKKNRSSQPAVCQGNENLGNEEENDLTHVTDLDSSNGKIAAAESNVATMKSTTSENTKAAFTPCNAEIYILTEEKNKSKETDSGRTNQGQKRKAVLPAKQDRRVSPRNFLPRTRSQHKAQTGKHIEIISS